MTGYETLLLIHVLGAFLIVAGLAVATPIAFGAALAEPAGKTLTTVSAALFGLGGALTLLFGLWLVADRDYGLLDGWIVGALVLWVVVAATGTRVKGPATQGFYWAAVAGTLAIVALMIFKPGA